jgi:(p)ppGpp synthase/HD superfamily hydrolase
MTPAEEAFIQRVMASAAMLAEFFANETEEQMMAVLSDTRENLTAELTETFGADVAALFADRFVATVIGRRRELLAN